MCEEEGTRGGDGTAEAARCGSVGREEVGCVSGSSGGTLDDKVGEGDKRDDRESSPQPSRSLRGGKVAGRKRLDVRRRGGRKREGRR